jgi:hypothetical protein
MGRVGVRGIGRRRHDRLLLPGRVHEPAGIGHSNARRRTFDRYEPAVQSAVALMRPIDVRMTGPP